MPPASASATPAALAEPTEGFLVVGFCAAWCNTCGEFRAAFDAIAGSRPDAAFVWLDIEDDAERVGDIDVENFPTIAVYDGDRLLHFGVTLPHGGVVARLIDSLDASSATFVADEAVAALPARLAADDVHPAD
jgi:thioredoxin reductase (NADPH)